MQVEVLVNSKNILAKFLISEIDVVEQQLLRHDLCFDIHISLGSLSLSKNK